jgi:DNA-binding IclR family transcriptional regulator
VNQADPDIVKSVARVFHVLELFDAKRVSLTATQIGKLLGYPPSSTIGLLKSMVKLGYVSFDCVDFTYLPTPRLPLIGQWVAEMHVAANMTDIMRRVHAVSGESVAVCVESDGQMQILALSPSEDLPAFSKVNAIGDCTPLFGSVVGLTALSMRPDNQVLEVASHLLRRPRYIRPNIDIPKAFTRIHRFRHSGFGIGYGVSHPNVGALAWAIAGHDAKNPLILGVWGPAERIRARESLVISEVTAALDAR